MHNYIVQQGKRYPYRILLVFLFFLVLLIMFSTAESLMSSLVSGTIIFFLVTILSAKLILGSNRWVGFFSAIFLLKFFLSISHYLIFVDPEYFQGNGALPNSFWYEYHFVFDQVSDLVKSKVNYDNIFYFDKESFEATHPEIWNLISIPLVYLGSYVLTITPINVFFTTLLSINFVFIAKFILLLDKPKVTAVAWTSALFPMFLLSDNFYRDPIGVGLLSVGLTLYFVSNTLIKKIVSIGLTIYFSYILRTVYPAIFLLSLLVYYLLIDRRNRKYLILFLPLILILLYSFVNENSQDTEYVSGYYTPSSLLYLPIKIIFGVIGPFPWTQFIMYKVDPSVSYQLSDYLLGIFQLSYLTLLIQKAKYLFKIRNLNVLTIFGFGIALLGIMTKQMHIGYIAEGILFTLPWFFSKITLADFRKRLGIVFIILLSLNILVGVLGNVGISLLWK